MEKSFEGKMLLVHWNGDTVKPVLHCHLKIDKTMVLMEKVA